MGFVDTSTKESLIFGTFASNMNKLLYLCRIHSFLFW